MFDLSFFLNCFVVGRGQAGFLDLPVGRAQKSLLDLDERRGRARLPRIQEHQLQESCEEGMAEGVGRNRFLGEANLGDGFERLP